MGFVDPEQLRDTITPDTCLISIMHANNEIGTIQSIRRLAAIAHDCGVPFHTDAVQSAGKLKIDVSDLGVDLLSISAHKFHGPKGVGALYIREGLEIVPLIHGGSQESGRRAGTTNVPGVVGMGKAAQMAFEFIAAGGERHLREKNDYLCNLLLSRIEGASINGGEISRVPCNCNILIPGVETVQLLKRLGKQGVCASGGSACNCEDPNPSHVLIGIGLSKEDALSSLRLTISKYTTEVEIDLACGIISRSVRELRDASG